MNSGTFFPAIEMQKTGKTQDNSVDVHIDRYGGGESRCFQLFVLLHFHILKKTKYLLEIAFEK